MRLHADTLFLSAPLGPGCVERLLTAMKVEQEHQSPYSPKCLEKSNSRNSISRILHSSVPIALEPPRNIPLCWTGVVYMLWCWIKMQPVAYAPTPADRGYTEAIAFCYGPRLRTMRYTKATATGAVMSIITR